MTVLATRPGSDTGRSRPEQNAFTGTARLLRFDVRRHRVRLTAWIVGIVALSVATATSFAGLYAGAQDRQGTAASMDSPAGLAMTGPRHYLTDYNLGSMMGHQMLGFTAVMVALMTIFLVVRHTRAEEESGRAELLRATVVGRHAHLAAALLVALLANLALAVVLTLAHGSLGIDGLTWSGSALYGAAHAAVGMVFAGVAAVTTQVMEHARGASGAAAAVLGASYVLRAIGDAGTPALSWASPIGWAQATYVYVDNRWWPLLLCAVVTVLLAGAGFLLAARRDLGAGLRQARRGRPVASLALRTPVGFALRLQRSVLIGFAVALAVIGVSYGAVLADVEEMLSNVEGADEMLAAVGGATITEAYLSMISVVMAIIASVFVVLATLRPRSEEYAGRAEPLLATRLSRVGWMSSHVAVALTGGAALSLTAALGLAVTGAATTGDTSLFGTAIGAALAYLPAQWVTAGVAVALYGWVPRIAPAAWLVPAYAFLVGYLGELLQMPGWLQGFSPFSAVPTLPAEEMAWSPLLALTIVAVALLSLGLAGLRRRSMAAA